MVIPIESTGAKVLFRVCDVKKAMQHLQSVGCKEGNATTTLALQVFLPMQIAVSVGQRSKREMPLTGFRYDPYKQPTCKPTGVPELPRPTGNAPTASRSRAEPPPDKDLYGLIWGSILI